MSVSREKYEKLKDIIQEWSEKYEHLEAEYEAELECQKETKKTIKTLKKELEDSRTKYEKKICDLERDKILAESKLQQIEESRKDLKERYTELKEEYKSILNMNIRSNNVRSTSQA